MVNLFLLLISLLTGIAFRYFNLVPDTASKTLNQLLVYLFIPAMTILYITEINFKPQFFLPVLSSWLVYGIGFVFFWSLSKWQGFDRKTMAALVMTGGIGSTSFVGFPLFELFYGKEGLEVGILMSMAGTILVCMTLGIATGSWFASSKPSIAQLFKNMLRFPPFIAFVLAVGFNIMGIQHAPIVKSLLEKIAAPFSVIALITVGLQVQFSISSQQIKPLGYGVFYKLFLAPLIIYVLLTTFTNADKMIIEIAVLGAGIGSMNLVSIIAIQMDLNPPLAAQMVGFGIPLSVFTLYGIHWILN